VKQPMHAAGAGVLQDREWSHSHRAGEPGRGTRLARTMTQAPPARPPLSEAALLPHGGLGCSNSLRGEARKDAAPEPGDVTQGKVPQSPPTANEGVEMHQRRPSALAQPSR